MGCGDCGHGCGMGDVCCGMAVERAAVENYEGRSGSERTSARLKVGGKEFLMGGSA